MPKTDPEVSKTYGSGSGCGTMLITLTSDDVFIRCNTMKITRKKWQLILPRTLSDSGRGVEGEMGKEEGKLPRIIVISSPLFPTTLDSLQLDKSSD
jgi:hypothetical protein